MQLIIVESPSKKPKLASYLPREYHVVASVGHVRDLPKSNKAAIDIDGGFVPHYAVVKGKEHIIDEIKKLSKKAKRVILATDPDREGEAIAWHIAEACNISNPERIVFHEITKSAILEALANPRKIDENLRSAQEARRVLDRLVGYDLSGLIWKKLRYGLSAGRVQSPALRIVVERERERRAFIPVRYFTIHALLTTPRGDTIEFTAAEEPSDSREAERIVEAGRTGSWSTLDIKETQVSLSPRPPFITSTLQQAASSRLGLSPSHTMSIAQRLYESGVITYLRTDSTTISVGAQKDILSFIEREWGAKYAESRIFKTKSKNAQEAHEAIRPTDIAKKSAGGSIEAKKLYQLIRARTLASQMASAAVLRTKVTANISEEKLPTFSTNGSRIHFNGWFAADPEGRGEEVIIPELKTGDTLTLKDISAEEKETQPPTRYSEAGLVNELEKRGIGRPSTYASIIKTLLNRGYVTKDGRSLIPTDTGEVVSQFLEEYFGKYVSDVFTAEMEEKLDDIANGERDYRSTLEEFYMPFHSDVESRADIPKISNLGVADPSMLCPVCKSSMTIKLGRSGKFLSCSRFPECTGSRMMDGTELAAPKGTGKTCPKCDVGELVEREGRYGKFIACGRYPKCRHVERSPEGNSGTGITCPECKKGEIVERRGRFGPFWSCSTYPLCAYALRAKPTGSHCDYKRPDGSICGALMIAGTKTIPERCSDKTCPNHNPHKTLKIPKNPAADKILSSP